MTSVIDFGNFIELSQEESYIIDGGSSVSTFLIESGLALLGGGIASGATSSALAYFGVAVAIANPVSAVVGAVVGIGIGLSFLL